MAYRWGFKTEANDIAREIRGEFGLGPLAPLDPRVLAESLEIPVLALSEFVAVAPTVAYLRDREPEAFSAVTVFSGRHRTIVHNDAHRPARQNSDIAHELAHGLLQHPPTPALNDKGCRNWSQDIEDEATWLAGALLVTEDATLFIVRRGMSREVVAERFQVSEQMIQFRLNATGAVKRIERARRYRAS
jgi:Zn-dependent peptidase ImmA (M78 family)